MVFGGVDIDEAVERPPEIKGLLEGGQTGIVDYDEELELWIVG